ncbi:type II toxin-antitoxin system VapC family toxin [Gloeocapsa sp. PCC 73106]|uniref:type II toxin-antitoxin system VapC family toxin n=1 Tax=Gloeocapsa sp. PCC 73106 TaxID=102232 RepID=UPI0002ACEB65|nr:type II toxin-antitoxin system VapC family toxin [Gloeocapsa sp. PCC 73106]ELR99567.1 hypothetical protein GLO73106DRAFT_00034190 [Gloeocapsa sp. PCC 73106]
MKLLLDTHALLWWLSDNPTIREEAKKAIASADNLVFVSAVSAWEISMKRAMGKLTAPENISEALVANLFQPLPISVEHGEKVGKLPSYHKDPFDRMLIAQALSENLIVVTRDSQFAPYGLDILRA